MRMSRALALEIVVIVVALLALKGGVLGYALAGLLLVTALILGVPIRRMTLIDRMVRRRRFRRRNAPSRRSANLPTSLAPLGKWVPELSVKQTRSARGDDVGVVTDGECWTALLGLVTDDQLFPDKSRDIDLSALRGLTVQDDITFATLQVIDFVVPAPSRVMLPNGSVAIESYNQILGSASVPPSVRRTWIGVRLDPRLCLEAIGTRGASDEGIYATLRFGLHRVQSALKRQGIITRELTANQINDVLAVTAGTSADAFGQPSVEHWDHWSCDGFEHAGRVIESWGPTPAETHAEVLQTLSGLSIIFGVCSYTLDSHDRSGGAVRVMTTNVAAAKNALAAIKKSSPRVDFAAPGGEQVPVLLGTIPMARQVAA